MAAKVRRVSICCRARLNCSSFERSLPDPARRDCQTSSTRLSTCRVETGSLCPALHRLEAKGWIEAEWRLSDKAKRARYHKLTPLGADSS